MVDLTTRYMGLTLRNPLIASSSPLTGQIETIRQLEDAGAAAIVLPSLFEEQIRHDSERASRLSDIGEESFPEASGYFPAATRYNGGPHIYLDLVRRARAAVNIPVIASLNGTSEAGLVEYAALIEEAGASGIELNIYRIASTPSLTGSQVEAQCLSLFRAVRGRVRCPVGVKLHPHYSAFGDLARQLDQQGANGLVLFNRLYQPDIDLIGLSWRNDVALSTPQEIRLGLVWLTLLSGKLGQATLAASTGVETSEQVIKFLLAGADAVMTTSSLLRHGPAHMRSLLDGLEAWMGARDFQSLASIRGLMQPSHPDADSETRERGDYIRSLASYRGKYVRN